MSIQVGIGSFGGTLYPSANYETGNSYEQKITRSEDPGQNIWQKARKSSKIGQDQKSLIFFLA